MPLTRSLALAAALFPVLAGAAAPATLDAAKVDSAFATVNPDNDGTVDWKEAERFGLTKAIFEKANPDKDGTLDKKEFADAVRLQFEAANPDKDGTLDWAEAQKAGIKAKATFDAANPDKDGTLDLNEFVDALLMQMKK